MKIAAEFVVSAASVRDLPGDGLPEIALVGRSNVGKSTLINALTRRRLARTSAAPGKTRLANVYRVARGPVGPLYLVDLPGYGYARGGGDAAREFAELARAFFGRVGHDRAPGPRGVGVRAILLVDARHPGLASDLAAWAWLLTAAGDTAIVATKIDKLARGQRIRATRALESAFQQTVLPCSAVTGEGLDELWKLIDRLVNRRTPRRRSGNSRGPKATAEPPPKE